MSSHAWLNQCGVVTDSECSAKLIYCCSGVVVKAWIHPLGLYVVRLVCPDVSKENKQMLIALHI